MRVIDSDSHIFEPDNLYLEYVPSRFRHLLPPVPDYGLLEGATPLGGGGGLAVPVIRPTECKQAHPDGGYDPIARLDDMKREGIEKMVCFPSVVTSLCRYPQDVEAVMIAAYNSWLADFCSKGVGRLFGVLALPLRDIEVAVREVRRWADHPSMVGITIPTRIVGANLDDPHFEPLWRCADELDLPILVHSGTARPPYPLGTELQSDNFFLMHLMHHPTEQMLALSALVGGGVIERHQGLRWGFFESGCGWVPWYLERIVHHVNSLPGFVPNVRNFSLENLLSRVYFSCDPDECSIEHFIENLGSKCLLYASDYPHWDSSFPNSVQLIKENPRLTREQKDNILFDNAQRLYPKLGLADK